DEQTGGDFASMLSRLPKRRDVKITVTNGVHTSSLDPTTLWNWLAFLDLYVAEKVADQSRLTPIAPLIYHPILCTDQTTSPLLPAAPQTHTARRLYPGHPPLPAPLGTPARPPRRRARHPPPPAPPPPGARPRRCGRQPCTSAPGARSCLTARGPAMTASTA